MWYADSECGKPARLWKPARRRLLLDARRAPGKSAEAACTRVTPAQVQSLFETALGGRLSLAKMLPQERHRVGDSLGPLAARPIMRTVWVHEQR